MSNSNTATRAWEVNRASSTDPIRIRFVVIRIQNIDDCARGVSSRRGRWRRHSARVQVPPPASDRPIHRRSPPGRHVLAFVSPSACAEASLVIEIDGDSHAESDQTSYDTARSQWLEERGYRVIRFAAREVGDDLAGVVCPSRSSSRPFGGVHPEHCRRAQDAACRGARDAPGTPPGPCTRRGYGGRLTRGLTTSQSPPDGSAQMPHL